MEIIVYITGRMLTHLSTISNSTHKTTSIRIYYMEIQMTSVAIQTQLTPEEYLTWERKAITKSEYVGGKIVAMSGASFTHNIITTSISTALDNQLMDGDYIVMTSDMRVKATSTSSYFYPDVVVVCDKPQFEDNTFNTFLNPIVIVEVLSPSTETCDRVGKFAHYQQLESLKEYILVSQDEVHVEHYIREETLWKPSEFRSLDNFLSFTSVECKLPLQDIYRRVDFLEN